MQCLRSLRFLQQGHIAPTTPDNEVASISQTRDGVRITSVNILPPGATSPSEITSCSILGALRQGKELDKWSLQSANVVDNGCSIVAAIIPGAARAVSDDSFKNEMGTSASILFHTKFKDPQRIIRVNYVSGNRDEQSSYCSELAGVSCSLSIMEAVCTVHDVQMGSITIGLNGEQAMIAASEDWPLNPESPDYDLLTGIRVKVLCLPMYHGTLEVD